VNLQKLRYLKEHSVVYHPDPWFCSKDKRDVLKLFVQKLWWCVRIVVEFHAQWVILQHFGLIEKIETMQPQWWNFCSYSNPICPCLTVRLKISKSLIKLQCTGCLTGHVHCLPTSGSWTPCIFLKRQKLLFWIEHSQYLVGWPLQTGEPYLLAMLLACCI
jgi:hypothetical protein